MEDKKNPINPGHYRKYPLETIDMMERIFGTQATINYCLLTAFKYRMRMGHKDDIGQEMGKEKWYLEKAKQLYNKRDYIPAPSPNMIKI